MSSIDFTIFFGPKFKNGQDSVVCKVFTTPRVKIMVLVMFIIMAMVILNVFYR